MPFHLLSTKKTITNHQTKTPKTKKKKKPESPNSLNHPMICRSPRKWRFICLRCNAMSDTLRTQSYVMLSQQTKTQFLGPSLYYVLLLLQWIHMYQSQFGCRITTMYSDSIQISFGYMVRGWKGRKNLRLRKKRSSQSLVVKTTCFAQYLRYLNPKGEDSSCEIDVVMATFTSKLKWA